MMVARSLARLTYRASSVVSIGQLKFEGWLGDEGALLPVVGIPSVGKRLVLVVEEKVVVLEGRCRSGGGCGGGGGFVVGGLGRLVAEAELDEIQANVGHGEGLKIGQETTSRSRGLLGIFGWLIRKIEGRMRGIPRLQNRQEQRRPLVNGLGPQSTVQSRVEVNDEQMTSSEQESATHDTQFAQTTTMQSFVETVVVVVFFVRTGADERRALKVVVDLGLGRCAFGEFVELRR